MLALRSSWIATYFRGSRFGSGVFTELTIVETEVASCLRLGFLVFFLLKTLVYVVFNPKMSSISFKSCSLSAAEAHSALLSSGISVKGFIGLLSGSDWISHFLILYRSLRMTSALLFLTLSYFLYLIFFRVILIRTPKLAITMSAVITSESSIGNCCSMIFYESPIPV